MSWQRKKYKCKCTTPRVQKTDVGLCYHSSKKHPSSERDQYYSAFSLAAKTPHPRSPTVPFSSTSTQACSFKACSFMQAPMAQKLQEINTSEMSIFLSKTGQPVENPQQVRDPENLNGQAHSCINSIRKPS